VTEKNKAHRKMLINVTHAEESRVAIVNDGVLESFEIETVDHKATKGNIYKGVVESVHAGLQACFVDIGEQRSGFLPLDEVSFKVHPSRKEGGRGRIENHLAKGQEVLVQVSRDAYGSKPPTVSTYFSLPGRYLVLTPYNDASGVSRKLDDKQRERVRQVIASLDVPEGFGVIARTAVAGATKAEMQRDLKYLLRLWERIEAASKESRAGLIYSERSLVIRTIRDHYTPDIGEVLVDHERTHQEILDFFEVVLPHRKKDVKFYQGDRPILNKYNLEEQIENIFRRRVPLPSGGALVFDQTEALTAIDVNSGRMKQEGHIEDTATKANVEAAAEIARQLRLRDLGGLIVVDFIDMRAQKNVRQVEKAVKDAMKPDKARYDITRLSRLGLMEISRERLNPQKSSLRYTDCPACKGTGSIKTVEAAAMQALRKLQTRVVRGDLQNVEIVLPPDVAEYIANQKRRDLLDWEERYHTQILTRSDPEMGRDDNEIRTVLREKSASTQPLLDTGLHGQILAEIDSSGGEPEAEQEAETAEAQAEGSTRKKRRRRRRKKPAGDSAEGKSDEASDETRVAAEASESAAAGEPAAEAQERDEAARDGDGEGNGNGNGRSGKRKRRRRRRKKSTGTAADAAETGARPDGASGTPTPPLAAALAAENELPPGSAPRPRWWQQLLDL
jgi:ribonuclease E